MLLLFIITPNIASFLFSEIPALIAEPTVAATTTIIFRIYCSLMVNTVMGVLCVISLNAYNNPLK